ncbi:HAD superfamily TIGR01668, putative [Babesia ovata]|uniref:HAD superfamily TIGR01668, putative n=1 Tax=Babesia ovata TaxID=189622 RepID=A0A2H6KIZ9_9APIC|nr:HAD superfamily TIGR01668, putative [Babesia ovata]GBE62967.1 HAD superfamily TIGR01668, putative [Babesia ovata]
MKVLGELSFDVIVDSVETWHITLDVNLRWNITLTNLPSRLFDGRLGGSPDLLFGGGVESANGGGKFVHLSFKIFCDVFSKLVFKSLNLLPHRLQPFVHGLGGAFIFAGGRDAGRASRLFQLLVEIIYSRFNLVQNFAKLVDA